MKKNILLKVKAGSIVLMLLLAFFVTNIQPARATIPVSEVASIPQIMSDVKLTVKEKIAKILKTVGAKLVGTTVRNTLNRLAMDAAKFVASAGEGQKPTYIVSELGSYWKNVGDAAAGDFIDSIGEDWGIDLCTPPSPNIQAKISLGLVQTVAPTAPDCTITKLVTNYSSAYEKLEAMKTGDYLKALQVNFDPTGSELGGALTLFGRTISTSTKAAETEKDKTLVNKGWLDVRNIAGKLEGAPDTAKDALTTAKNIQAQSLLVSTGDVLVDAANTFLNQLAYEGFQRALRELSKGAKDDSDGFNISSSGFESVIQYGESLISEKLASVIKPRFDIRSDYSIITDLVSCVDKNNPSPTSCVIDDKFSQAISEKLTVGEALNKGYLHGDWLVSNDNKSESTYTLRSASILRKYRIVPVGWEQAISEATKNNYKATFQDLISCFSKDDSFSLFSNEFNKNNQDWCRGLVDPNWVLKAPLNYCSKEGYGNQILNSLISQDANGLAVLAVSRADDYCADDQTCIKEKADGSCEVYGYCNEEKRTWKFNTDSCEPVYNTCQTFTSASDKQVASFLENTLDYSTCDQNNSGCSEYSSGGDYLVADNSVAWSKNYSIFFNNKIKACDSSNEGCTELLRGKAGWQSVNYVMNSDFVLDEIDNKSTSTTTDWHWPIDNGVGTIVNFENEKALSITGQNRVALYSDDNNNLLPKNLSPIPGWSYTLSADVKLISGDKIVMTFSDNEEESEVTGYELKNISVTVSDIKNLNFKIEAIANNAEATFIIKNINLTPNNYNPGFSSYANFPVYEKLLPNYLESSCYNSVSGVKDYTLKDNAPSVCNNFVRKCNLNEVGCELFTSVKDIFKVAAKANVNDYCDASCVGYDAYLAKESYFYETSVDNLIPSKTTSCTAESVGCSSFTNLDAATSGGEKIEYYTKIRQCIKPDTASCGDFYSWDNSQLKVMSLKKDDSGNPAAVNSELNSLCNKEIYNLPIDNPRYNSDCREFYSKTGVITYQLLSNTISCSDNCYSYRLNEKNIDDNLDAASCVDSNGIDRTWDAAQSLCYVCKNGGVWNASQKACVYKAIPNEGSTCGAENVGCREYNGNNGNSLKLQATYDFDANTSGFYALSGSTVTQSTESTVKNGRSLSITGHAAVDVSGFATKDSAYVVKFMAKAASNTGVYFSMVNNEGEASFFNKNNPLSIKGGGTWNIYEINLEKLDHKAIGEILKIEVTGNIIIDNLIINEIEDKYYLIKNTSQIPDVCFYDIFDNYQGPNYNLGCSAYTDRAGTTHNLYKFSELCQNSAVGCEQMIQTNNSSNYYDYTVNLNSSDRTADCVAGDVNCLEVKGAQAIYAVFDEKKQCNSADTGCSRFGQFKIIGNTSSWIDTYKINLPDSYLNDVKSPLCRANEVGCDTWITDNGAATYFKNPGINACVFRNNKWYKMPVKRCDANGNGKIDDAEKNGAICFADSSCSNKKCITDNNNYDCNVTTLKTIGLGGEKITTPDGAVGLCTAEQSGCSEYIDPVSKYVNNLIYNPKAEELSGNAAEKWTASANNTYYQRINIKPNKLYILQVEGNNNGQDVVLNNFSNSYEGAGGDVRLLKEDNSLSALTKTIATKNSVIFNSGDNNYLTVLRHSITTNAAQAATISLKEAIINYQLKSNIDTSSCNGNVNVDAGCVLFNTRTQAGASGLKRNIFMATSTDNTSTLTACPDNDPTCFNNANSIIKVSPDRICSRWLSCQTYTTDPTTNEKTCYKMGECDRLDEKNECANFLPVDSTIRDIKNTQNKNATGYSLLDNWYIGGMKEVGVNTDAHFDFESSSVNLTCKRGVDITLSTPNLFNVKNSSCTFDRNINESLVLTPENTPTDYPAHGKGFLKVLNYYQISPQSANSWISIYTNQDYYINYLVNTKGSSAQAKLLINEYNRNNSDGVVRERFINSANNGWERKIYKFRIPNSDSTDTSKRATRIKIYLTSDATNLTTGYVYFDDINIEPVLQTGINSYVSKDCRLYPSDDSPSCLSANNNIIKDGLYGYCLQYDPLNPGVCLMWYPVDKISPVTKNNQSVLGYSGKFPLYYCTEANGNFDLVEKRNGVFHVASRNENDQYKGVFDNIEEDFSPEAEEFKTSCPEGISVSEGCYCLNDAGSKKICGNNTDYVAVWSKGKNKNEAGNDTDYFLFAYCVPKPNNLLVIAESKSVSFEDHRSELSCTLKYNNGWGIYNGFWYKEKVNEKTGGADENSDFDSTNLVSIDEANNTTGTKFDSVMILENGKKIESDLKYISGSNFDEVFKISCNKFSKFVENDGTNKAWSGRISKSSIYSTTTPNFFDKSFEYLKLFGRNREDIPFGAASITSDYNLNLSEPLVLRNQYSKQLNETLFAGRPYGCLGKSCNNIGQCSLNPNVFCIYSSDSKDNINSKSCSASGSGSCIPLWGDGTNFFPREEDAIRVLNQIFIDKYGDFVYNSESGGYINVSSPAPFKKFEDLSGGSASSHNVTNVDGIRYVRPIINNAVFKTAYSKNASIIGDGKILIPEAGLYQLSFNVKIDNEQQPMKQIIIDWGDSTQVISGIDNKPESSSPHTFYHFYLKNAEIGYQIKIKTVDNWGSYACWSTNGTSWTDDCGGL